MLAIISDLPSAVVLVLQPKAPHVSVVQPNRIKHWTRDWNVREFVDVVFWNNKLYSCPHNDKAVQEVYENMLVSVTYKITTEAHLDP